MAGYDNMFGGRPSNNSLWVGNNYSAAPGYGNMQMPRNNYPSMGQTPNMMQSNPMQDMQMQPNQMQNMQMQSMQMQSINNILQVMGPESAQAFQVGPNSKVILMDSNRSIFYTKESDSSGYSKTRAFKFNEIPIESLMESQHQAQSQEDNSHNPDYITKAEFNDFKKMIEELVMRNE